jgi:predicted lipoprotein with Yx(FWY)xxD motif
LGLSVLVVAILATAAVAEMANNYAINTSTNKTLGTYLVNQTGFTLYYFKMDPGNGTSACSGGCVTLWPPFYTRKGLKN